ncbi:MAG: Gfo/Idh/MocA family protein, partial [Candidatus Bipolaricaulota bacterium]
QLGNAELIGIACEKPLAKNVREAREMVKLVKGTNLIHGYLENQVFAPAIVKGKKLMWGRGAKASGRPYLARAAEEHSGPHSSWFWSGVKQGGGALNDMLCHSLEAARFLLTEPERHRDSIQIESVNANTGFLKWTRPEYIEQLKKNTDGKVDYSKSPSEDYASANLRLTTETGQPAVIEATSSWCFTGSGLRINFELLGPEYSMKINSLNTDLQVFLGREVQGEEGEDMIEKQNAEQGSMPVLTNEAETYGYIAENRHMVEHFLDGTPPREDWEDGLEVIQLLMASYMSAESGRELPFPPDGLEEFIPAVAKK